MTTRRTAHPLKVAVALSGGVDSSAAAALLVDEGYDVVAVMMRLWATHHSAGLPDNRCCSPVAIGDARRVCELLGIPFHLLDLEAEFKSQVVDHFCAEYAAGRTPNPCLACNRHLKFGTLLRVAFDLGAQCLATGHYARIRALDGKFQLLRGVDPRKDQSYVLYMLGQRELAHLMFPLGVYSKPEVRELAARFGLPTAAKAESQDVCFVSDRDYRGFVAQQRPETNRPGPILDAEGHLLGQHRGVAFYTVGQRQGLGIAARHPLYVMEVDMARNALVVGPKRASLRSELLAGEVTYVSGNPPPQPAAVWAKIRYKADEVPATLVPLPGQRAKVVFREPQPAITPGQGVVFYQDDVVVGGGVISSVRPVEV